MRGSGIVLAWIKNKLCAMHPGWDQLEINWIVSMLPFRGIFRENDTSAVFLPEPSLNSGDCVTELGFAMFLSSDDYSKRSYSRKLRGCGPS